MNALNAVLKQQRAAARGQAAVDKRVDAAYRARCCNIPINMLDIQKIFKVGRDAVAEGVDDEVLSERIYAYVQTIRQDRRGDR